MSRCVSIPSIVRSSSLPCVEKTRRQPPRRMSLLAFLGLGVVGSLSASTAPVDGLIGITLDGSGQPNVVISPVTITLAA